MGALRNPVGDAKLMEDQDCFSPFLERPIPLHQGYIRGMPGIENDPVQDGLHPLAIRGFIDLSQLLLQPIKMPHVGVLSADHVKFLSLPRRQLLSVLQKKPASHRLPRRFLFHPPGLIDPRVNDVGPIHHLGSRQLPLDQKPPWPLHAEAHPYESLLHLLRNVLQIRPQRRQPIIRQDRQKARRS